MTKPSCDSHHMMRGSTKPPLVCLNLPSSVGKARSRWPPGDALGIDFRGRVLPIGVRFTACASGHRIRQQRWHRICRPEILPPARHDRHQWKLTLMVDNTEQRSSVYEREELCFSRSSTYNCKGERASTYMEREKWTY